MRLLLINANTSVGVTDLCAAAARAVAAPSTEIVPLTGRFGPKIIQSRAENAIAAHALLELVAEHRGAADAILIAVSYDTGLAAARELAGIPVIGITQASLLSAGLAGQRIGLVTFGTPPLYRELAEAYGIGSRLAGIEVVTASARDAYAKPAIVLGETADAAGRLVTQAAADVVVLCGAAFSGMATTLRDAVPVPILDGVGCGVPLCEAMVSMGIRGRAAAPGGEGAIGLSAALDAALYR